jgi:hypothetical protein
MRTLVVNELCKSLVMASNAIYLQNIRVNIFVWEFKMKGKKYGDPKYENEVATTFGHTYTHNRQ